MNRCLLAAALVLACSAQAAAWSGKTHGKTKQTHVGSAPESQLTSPKPKTKFERGESGEIKDPYWEPCDYTTDWGPNGCGGS